MESIAQAENESRSENIKWSIKQRAAQGTSKLYDRKRYGYKHDESGHLVIDEEKAKNVKLIFDLYLSGQSVVGIIKELAKRKILSPTGKEKWYLHQSTKEYSFDAYKEDVILMTDEDVIENMTAELYKLNDINRQKLKTNRWVMRSFSLTLIVVGLICVLLVASVL